MKDWLSWPAAAALPKSAATSPHEFDVGVLGSGIAGACLARQLASAGIRVGVFDQGNSCSARIPALLVRRYPERSASLSHRLYQHAFDYAATFYPQHCPNSWQASQLDTPAGVASGGILRSTAALAELLSHATIEQHTQRVQWAQHSNSGWQLQFEDGSAAWCKDLVLCCASAPDWLDLHAPISPCSGQVIDVDKALARAFCDQIHGIPLGTHSQIGSSYRPGDAHASNHTTEAQDLLHQAQRLQPTLRDAQISQSHAGVRQVSGDHLPLIGPTPDMSCWVQLQQQHENRRNPAQKPAAPYLPGLWLNLAHGSRGATMAPLAAQLLNAAIQGFNPDLPANLLKAIHPGRFASRAVRRREL